eukprot:Hpha_TRINITY_DN34379_c0_g1::TRINITY_DN34379_c0_g1_i1::g.109631::m.109631
MVGASRRRPEAVDYVERTTRPAPRRGGVVVLVGFVTCCAAAALSATTAGLFHAHRRPAARHRGSAAGSMRAAPSTPPNGGNSADAGARGATGRGESRQGSRHARSEARGSEHGDTTPQPPHGHRPPRTLREGDAVQVLRSSGAWTPATLEGITPQGDVVVVWEERAGKREKHVVAENIESDLRFDDGRPARLPASAAVPSRDTGYAGGEPPADGAAPAEESEFASLDERIAATTPLHCGKKREREDAPATCVGPSLSPEWAEVKERTGCNLFNVPFVGDDDARCLAYLSDPSNWAEVKPGAQRYDERTVKFKVTFKDNHVRAIVKVRQRLFPNEAVSEVGSFHADRVMGCNRVPPTAWVQAPLRVLREAVRKEGPSMLMIPIFAKDSQVASFVEWVEKDFVGYSRSKGWVKTGEIEGEPEAESVGVSVQLYIPDVRPMLDSALRIPWVPHNDSWQRHLSPRSPFHPKYTVSYVRQSELALYDFVLGNGDRSPNKNNFVVGACRNPNKCGAGPRHPGPPNFLTLDNGIMFMYPLNGPRTADGPNPLLKNSFCFFERKLLTKLQGFVEAGDTAFADAMEKVLPTGIRKWIGRKNLLKCENRIRKILTQLDRCLQRWPRHRVIFS